MPRIHHVVEALEEEKMENYHLTITVQPDRLNTLVDIGAEVISSSLGRSEDRIAMLETKVDAEKGYAQEEYRSSARELLKEKIHNSILRRQIRVYEWMRQSIDASSDGSFSVSVTDIAQISRGDVGSSSAREVQ